MLIDFMWGQRDADASVIKLATYTLYRHFSEI